MKEEEEIYKGNQFEKVERSESERSTRIQRASKLTGYSTDSLSKAKQVMDYDDDNER